MQVALWLVAIAVAWSPDGKHHRLEIEMQSGDTIILEAENFQLTGIEGSRRARKSLS